MISRIRPGSAAAPPPKTQPGSTPLAPMPPVGHSAASTFVSNAREVLEPAFALVRIALHTNNEATLLKGARSLAVALDVTLPAEAESGAQALTALGQALVGAGFTFRGPGDFKALQRSAIDALSAPTPKP